MKSDLQAVARIIDRTRWLLLDFDGPICSIFAGISPSSVAAQLRDVLAAEGVQLSEAGLDGNDPLQVLRSTASLDSALTTRVECTLRAAELTASRTAEPTPHARETILACHATNRTVAVVSNNSQVAVESYLRIHELDEHVDLVVGRTQPDPRLLKPNPYLVLQAMQALGADPDASVFLGDTSSDMHSAQAAGILSIGYANKPGKRDHLLRAGASAVITTMAHLETALLTQPSTESSS
jgi:HAD superfamily hydrolase (TIGR01509 family)